MNLAADLIAELAVIDVRLVVDGENLRYQGPKSAVTPDHLRRLKELKPEIQQRLIDQHDAITRSVRVMLASDPPVFSMLNLSLKPGFCPSCAEPQPLNQDTKCVVCCLASIRVGRVVDGIDTPPEDEIVPVVEPIRLPSWDYSCGVNVAGDWSWCLSCQVSRAEAEGICRLNDREPSLVEVVS